MKQIKRNSAIRSISFQVENKDLENRTIEVVASTGAKVLRYRWFEDPVYEEIEISKDSIDFTRFGSSCAPLLKDHNYDLKSQIGVIENSWVEEGKLKAKIRFSKRDDVEPIFQDVLDGILRNVSIGYQVLNYKKYKKEGDKYETVRATKILPHELSFVAVPADPDAGVRSLDDDYIPQIILQHRSLLMSANQNATNSQKVSNSEPDNSVRENPVSQATSSQVKELSKKDIMEINRICSESLLDLKRANEIINSVNSLEEAKIRVSEIILEDFKSRNSQMTHSPNITMGTQESEHTRAGIQDALTYRILGTKENINDNSKRFVNLSLIEIARKLVRNGELYDYPDLFQRTITSTDLPLMLSNIADKILRERYKYVNKTYEKIVRKVEVSDLNFKTELQTGSFRALDNLGELEAYTAVSFSESKEIYKTAKHGNKFSFSEEMFINDQLNVLNRTFQMFADSTIRKLTNIVFDNITLNNEMSDGKPLFHKDRGNIIEDKKMFSNETITQALLAKNNYKDKDGNRIVINDYKYIYTTAANEPIIKRILTPVQATKSDDIAIYANRFEIVVENKLEELGKYPALFVCDPMDIDCLILSHLKGYDEPRITRIDDPNINAVTFTCKMFAGSKAIDYKGLFLHNPTISPTT